MTTKRIPTTTAELTAKVEILEKAIVLLALYPDISPDVLLRAAADWSLKELNDLN